MRDSKVSHRDVLVDRPKERLVGSMSPPSGPSSVVSVEASRLTGFATVPAQRW